jgi:vitamin B12 transporter
LGATLLAEGKRYEDTANTQKLGGFGTLDLRASYRFNNNWLLRGRCENLFDKGYETVTNYNQPGRSFYLTLSYQS